MLAASELSGVAGWMLSLIDALGPIGVGLVILAENVFPPIPSEAVLPAAGNLVGIGQVGFVSTLIAATLGSVAGALVLYGLGSAVSHWSNLAVLTGAAGFVGWFMVRRVATDGRTRLQ
ncbi:MAG: hypothetical protein R2770_18800 [Acidimicrobiales bacterium]